ncbi:conserved protein, unknown function, partial [Hepatocystis sp. ex Piliocolobus tephrosceles]
MQNTLLTREICVYSKLRRNVYSNVNDNYKFENNSIELNITDEKFFNATTVTDDNNTSGDITIDSNTEKLRSYIEQHKHISDNNINLTHEINYNLINKYDIYGINLYVDMFILPNSNIVFFIENIINIYNPYTKNIKNIFTKFGYTITCATLFDVLLIIVLFSPTGNSYIQVYYTETQVIKEEIELKDRDYYEKIFAQIAKNYFLLLTNENVLKVIDVKQKIIIFNIFLHMEYSRIVQ